MAESKHPNDAADQIDMSNPTASQERRRLKMERIERENAEKMRKLHKRPDAQ